MVLSHSPTHPSTTFLHCSGGLGQIDHTHLHKNDPEIGMLVVKIGGPAYRIGMGGGAASSVPSGSNSADLDFNAVQVWGCGWVRGVDGGGVGCIGGLCGTATQETPPLRCTNRLAYLQAPTMPAPSLPPRPPHLQRGDAEVSQKLWRVVRACVELGDKNPIEQIHDQVGVRGGQGRAFECGGVRVLGGKRQGLGSSRGCAQQQSGAAQVAWGSAWGSG